MDEGFVLSVIALVIALFVLGIYLRYMLTERTDPPRPGQGVRREAGMQSPGARVTEAAPEQTDEANASLHITHDSQSPPSGPVQHSAESVEPGVRVVPFFANVGSSVFALLACLSLLVSLVKGVVPIYLLEAAFWGAMAWVWYAKRLTGYKTNLAVLLLAVLIAAGEGFVVGQHFGGNQYTYMNSGQTPYRFNASGRTDKLTARGWLPVSFDTPAEELPADAIAHVTLSGGTWQTVYASAPEICFDVQNNSSYIIRDVIVHAGPVESPNRDFGTFWFSDVVTLKPKYDSLLNTGAQEKFCGNARRDLPPDSKWRTFDPLSAKGWKQ